MKMKFLFIATAILACLSQARADEDIKKIKSTLKESTVFFQGAELTHTASMALTKGENEIKIEGLSPIIDKNSLKIKASNGVIVSASEFSVDYISARNNENIRIREMKDSVDFYTKQVQQININQKVNSELGSILKESINKNVSGSEKGLSIDELMFTMNYFEEKAAELETKRIESQKQLTECNTAIRRLNSQIQQEEMKNNKTAGVLKLTLSSPLATTCNFTISYYTAGASWNPYYDINIESTDKPIKILSKAKVRQTTGLDWEKVKLTLSTATPSNGKIAPVFKAWFLREQIVNTVTPRSIQARQSISSISNSLSAVSHSELSEIAVKATVAPTESQKILTLVNGVEVDDANDIDQSSISDYKILTNAEDLAPYGDRGKNGVILITTKSATDYISESDNQMNVTYAIDLPFSVPGNGKEQSLDLKAQTITADYRYYCAPKLDTETYLLAEIDDWQKLNLLTGKANITYDGTYVGETLIDASTTERTLNLTLGSEKRVTVKREKVHDFSSKKTFGNDIKQEFSYKLTVRNNQNKPVKMTLKEQYPRSTQKNIEVELIEKETTPWNLNREETGVITWEEELGAGETKTYLISYSVKYPKSMIVNL